LALFERAQRIDARREEERERDRQVLRNQRPLAAAARRARAGRRAVAVEHLLGLGLVDQDALDERGIAAVELEDVPGRVAVDLPGDRPLLFANPLVHVGAVAVTRELDAVARERAARAERRDRDQRREEPDRPRGRLPCCTHHLDLLLLNETSEDHLLRIWGSPRAGNAETPNVTERRAFSRQSP